MKTLLKIYALPIIFGMFVLFGLLNRCNQPEIKDNTFDLRSYLVDSIQTANLAMNVAEIQAVKEQQAIITQQWKLKAEYYRSRAGKVKIISDSLLVYVTDTNCIKVVESKQSEIDTLNLACNALENEAIGYSRQLFLCENQNQLKDTIINNLNNNTERLNREAVKLVKSSKRSWIERNKIWIGAIAGMVGGYIVFK